MAYFDCIVGGSGKGNTVTVTCAEEFAGLTITLSKTGKTYTKTCPSTAPYVVTFNGVENGTYTVSCTVGGQTYSETVVVQDISCVLNYGFNWKLWVDTASQLDSSDYASLSEVLADEKALRELFLEHACVDYMAEATSSNATLETIINNDYCAKWINNSDYALDFLGANTVIKALMDTADKYGYGEWVITDDTTTPPTWGAKGNVPVMTANNAPYGTASAYQVFDGNASTTASGTDFSYKFVNPICPKDFYCNVSGGTLQASNDGSTWSVPTSGSYYLYLRLHFASSVSPHTIQFYGRELKASVPTMTSNTAPFGEAIILPSANPSSPAWRMFDKSLSSYSGVPDNTEYPHRYGYIFNNKDIVLKMITVQSVSNHGEYNPKNCSLEYTEDGITWEETSEIFTLANSTALQVVPISGNSIKGKGFRIIATNGYYTTYNWSGIGELQFYGLDYSEKEFEVGTTKKWLYDHGVELETMTSKTAISGSNAEKKSDNLYMEIPATANAMAAFYHQLDLTNYNMWRFKVGENLYSAQSSINPLHFSAFTQLPSNGADTTYRIGDVAVAIGDSNAPYNGSLDVSAINQTCYLVLLTGNGSGTIVKKANVTELWLE